MTALAIPDEVGVLIAGAGAAGTTAALAIRARGFATLVVEASKQVGSTTATSAAPCGCPTMGKLAPT